MYRIYIEHSSGGKDRLFATVKTAQDCIDTRETMHVEDKTFAFVVDDNDEILQWSEVRKISKAEKKRYCVSYQFDGRGYVFIEAKSKAEAEELFYNGEYEGEDEGKSQNYEVTDISIA